MKNQRREAKYEQVKALILDRVRAGVIQPGERLPSEAELIDQLRVSRHTLRLALGALANEGWLDRRQGSGTYVKSRSSGPRRAALVGVVCTYISEYIFPSIVRGIERYLGERGYGVVLGSTDNRRDREPACIRSMLGHNVSGLIIEPAQSALPDPNLAPYREVMATGIPVVTINGIRPGLSVSSVTMDDTTGAYRLVEHLIDLGHHDIAVIVKTDDWQGVERESGALQAMRDRGIAPRSEWICRYQTSERETGPVQFVQQVICQPQPPTAVFCYNDQIALQVLPVLSAAGLRVPQDISLVGYDDSVLLSTVKVPLTTVAHPQEILGAKAAELLYALMTEPPRPYQQSVQYLPNLVARSSTAPPRQRRGTNLVRLGAD